MHANRVEKFPRNLVDVDEQTRPLYWKPICDNSDAIDNQLKKLLIESEMLDNNIITLKELGFLKGIYAASNFLEHHEIAESVTKIIDAIEVFGSIELFSRPGL